MGNDRGMTDPVMTKRTDPLGWLASTPPDHPLRFAVTGSTEDEARANFGSAERRWATLDQPSVSGR